MMSGGHLLLVAAGGLHPGCPAAPCSAAKGEEAGPSRVLHPHLPPPVCQVRYGSVAWSQGSVVAWHGARVVWQRGVEPG